MTSHDSWTDKLSEYLDVELSSEERAAVEAHLAECGECARTLEDLRQVVATAATLSPRAPRVDLWDGIAERLEPRGMDGRRRISFTIPQLAAASLLLATLSGGAAALMLRRDAGVEANRNESGVFPETGQAAQAQARATDVSLPSDTASLVPATSYADAQYDAAVADLERALRNGRGRLDDVTVLVVEENLAIIDRAILEARTALGADPSNGYLSGHLMEARRRKLSLLRRAAELAEAN